MPIIDYDQKAKRLEKTLFESTQISEKNKQLTQRFLAGYDVSPARMSIFLERILFLLKATNDVRELLTDRDQTNKIFQPLRLKYSPASYATILSVVLRFITWVNDGEVPVGFKDLQGIKWSKAKRKLNPNDMLTWNNGLELCKYNKSIQFDAIILTQLDAGFRPSEFVDLNYGDVSITDGIVAFQVNRGKTGIRTVIIYRATSYFLRWYHSHPTKKPNDPLWIREYDSKSSKGSNGVSRYAYAAICKRINKLGERSNLTKPLDFYNFRHSSCVLDKLDNLPVDLAAARHGHSVKYFTEVYGRLTTTDVINRFKSHYGESVAESEKPKNQICPTCQYTNELKAVVCFRCQSPLSIEKRAEIATGRFKELEQREHKLIQLENQIATMTKSLQKLQEHNKVVATREIKEKLSIP